MYAFFVENFRTETTASLVPTFGSTTYAIQLSVVESTTTEFTSLPSGSTCKKTLPCHLVPEFGGLLLTLVSRQQFSDIAN
jgi:hypothetical protein